MAGKFAVIVGNSDYEDTKLSRLCCPSADVLALSEVLQDAGLGAFDQVVTCVNRERIVVERAITSLYSNKHPDDLLLLYFSGHGIRDDEGDLYLAVKDTDHADLDGTAVISSFVVRVMNKSSSRRQIVILDCCHSGAFSSGFKGMKGEGLGASVGTKGVFEPEGYGRVVLTASDATQYAWEGDKIFGDAQNSLYTHFLIEGIRSGAADLRGDGRITVDELHDYVYRKVIESASKQRPEKFGAREEGQLVLSKAPLRPAPLPLEIQSSLNNTLSVNARRAVVDDLLSLIRRGSRGQALSAHAALASLLEDDSRSVRHAAARAMASYTGAQLDIDQDVLDETANDARNNARLQRGDSGRVPIDLSQDDDEKLDAEAHERQRMAERERLAREAQEMAVKAEQDPARESQERKQKAEQERLAREAQERAVKAERERLAKEDQERAAKAEQDLAREFQQRKLKAEQERLARETQEREQKAEQERLAREAQERAAKAERERLAKEDQERAAKAEQDLAREFQQRKLKAEQERLARETQERERKAEQERAEQQQTEREKAEQGRAEQRRAEQESIAREARLKANRDASGRARKAKKWMWIAIGCFVYMTVVFISLAANSEEGAGGGFLLMIASFVWAVIAYRRYRKAKLGL